MNSDVLIIGGGIIGLNIARNLRQKGVKKIKILERSQIGREASFAAAGMLAPQAETNKIDPFFHFCNQSNQLYPNFADEILAETGIDIELERSGTLYLAFTENDVKEIQTRYEWQQKAGLKVEQLTAEEVRKAEPFVSPDVCAALFFPNDWQVENRKLVSALQRFAEINDIELVTNTGVKSLLAENGKVIGAETLNHKFFAEKVVLATGAWTSLIKIDNFTLPLVKPIRGQMLKFQTAKRLFSHVIYSPRGYIVPRLDSKILAGATTEDVGFDNQITPSGINFVLSNTVEIAPSLANLEITEKWSGLRPYATDGLPILGEFSTIKNLFIATAHFRNGILLTPITGKIMAEKIIENTDSEYFEVFSPQRFEKQEFAVNG